MSVRLADLPQPLADAVAQARARIGELNPQPFIAPDLNPEVREWLHEMLRSGEFAKLIEEVAASDPDLAS